MPEQQQKSMNWRSCCYNWIIVPIVFILSFYFLFHNIKPICSIEEFDAFALAKAANSTTNRTLHYDLKLKNKNVIQGIYYDALNLTFYYKPNLSLFPIGNATYPEFYQGHHKSTHRVGNLQVPSGVMLENATAVFRVELATAIRFKNMYRKTKHHRLVVASDLQVNDQGSLVKGKKNKGIKLSSGAPKNKINGCFDLVGILAILVFIHTS